MATANCTSTRKRTVDNKLKKTLDKRKSVGNGNEEPYWSKAETYIYIYIGNPYYYYYFLLYTASVERSIRAREEEREGGEKNKEKRMERGNAGKT